MPDVVMTVKDFLKRVIENGQKRLDRGIGDLAIHQTKFNSLSFDQSSVRYHHEKGVFEGRIEAYRTILPDLVRILSMMEGLPSTPEPEETEPTPTPGEMNAIRENHEKQLYELAVIHTKVANLQDYTSQLERHSIAMSSMTEALSDIMNTQDTIRQRITNIVEEVNRAGSRYGTPDAGGLRAESGGEHREHQQGGDEPPGGGTERTTEGNFLSG